MSSIVQTSNGVSPAHLFQHVAVLECVDAATLAELAAGPMGRYIVRRLSDTVAVIDHAHFDTILKQLQKSGYTPKIASQELP